MAAAQRQGYHWPTLCRGQALCTACLLDVVDGAEHFDEIRSPEREALESVSAIRDGREGGLRLACQARPLRAATVFKRGVKPADTGRKPPWTVPLT